MGDIEVMLQKEDYKNVLRYFTALSRIPRGSGFNGRISDYLVSFAKEHGLRYVQDELKNIIIYKPASAGYEEHTGVIIQGHMDMVCVADKGVTHDFREEPLDLFVEGGMLGARGTTLGGDDGIAMAYGMALLADDTVLHPALEVVVTTDEETGMYGAKALDTSLLSGRFMINVDSEDEGVVLVSCAGGLRVTGTLPLERTKVGGQVLSLSLSGLLGGHSGAEIHKNRTNAVYLMARLLFDLKTAMAKEKKDFMLLSFSGGEKDNAIPCAARAEIVVAEGMSGMVQEKISGLFAAYRQELSSREPGMDLTVKLPEMPGKDGVMALHPADTERLLFLLLQAPDGVQKMSAEIAGLVESSLNLGIFSVGEHEARFHFSVRSSVGSYKYFLRDKLGFLFDFVGGGCVADSEYPAWEYRKNSVLREKFVEVFQQCYGREPKVTAIHAGLECGLFCEKIPDMDIISIGPDMKDIHTPKERLSIPSSIRVYRFLETLLAAL